MLKIEIILTNGVMIVDYIVRKMKKCEYYLLDLFLYEAIFQRNDTELLPKDIILRDDLQVYIKDFGTKVDDYCLCAVINNSLVVGAVWVRNIQGFGSVDRSSFFIFSRYALPYSRLFVDSTFPPEV